MMEQGFSFTSEGNLIMTLDLSEYLCFLIMLFLDLRLS